MKTDYIDYQDGDVALEGYFAWDETSSEPRPLVLVAHDWSGRREFACGAAERMVELGWCGLAVDIYGKGVFGRDGDTAGNSALMTPYASDRALLRQRMHAALAAARQLPQVDPDRIAAIGYCFGGMAVLELDATGFGMGTRSKRYAMIVDNGVVTHLAVEPAGGIVESAADAILARL